ncbi:hypothetical protein [Helicobacter sp. T3_23-1059]
MRDSRLLLKSVESWQSTPKPSLRASRKTCVAIYKQKKHCHTEVSQETEVSKKQFLQIIQPYNLV